MAKKNKDGKKTRKEAPARGALSSALTLAARSLRTVLSRNLLDSGLYAGQDGVILALAESGPMTPGALALRLGVKAPTMTRTIVRLEAQGFVSRQDDEGDGRAVQVRLTDAGLASVDAIGECIGQTEAQAADGLDGKEIRQLVKLLRKVDSNLVADREPGLEEKRRN
jgi:DNA-binding MarR family transcriptional regulator